MRRIMWPFLILACLVVAGAAYFWTSGLMDSVYAYRSPLRAAPPAAGDATGTALSRRVVFVLVDALRYDTSLKPNVMPFLAELRAAGAAARMRSRPPSFSAPGYSVLFIGAWPDLSDGPVLNLAYEDIPTWTQDNLVSAAHRAGLRTAVSGFNWFEKLIPADAVDVSFYTPGEDATADRQVVDAALPWLRDGGYQFVFVHLDQVDYAGHHEGGPRSPNWDAAARRVDDLLRVIAASLDFSRDTLLVVSDHGQIAQGGHGGTEPVTLMEPWVLVGAGVTPGIFRDVDQTDVAPTLAALLGANIPAASQGRVRTEMLALSPAQLAVIARVEAAQQGVLAQAYARTLGRPVPVSGPGDAVSVTQAAMRAALSGRLWAERAPRILLALLLAMLPAAAFVLHRGRTVAWLLTGALIYVLVFNLSYAVLAGRTYTLSSVTSSDDLILTVALTALAALLLAWLAVAWRMGIFRRVVMPLAGRAAPAQTATLTLLLALVLIYVLALPILLSFALNGLFVTWALPDFNVLFVALISGIQILAVAAGGVVLAGVAAFTAWINSR